MLLASIYRTGEGDVPKDIEKAIEYYTRASTFDREGHNQLGTYLTIPFFFSDPFFCLGHMYDTGTEVKLDYEKAAEHYTIAADDGCPIAQHNMGTNQNFVTPCS